MVHPIAREIRVDQLRLSSEAKRRLAGLAMSVEIRERKRFPVSNTADHIVELINVSGDSAHPEVKDARSSLFSSLNDQQEHMLIGFGAVLLTPLSAPAETGGSSVNASDKRYLFGARG